MIEIIQFHLDSSPQVIGFRFTLVNFFRFHQRIPLSHNALTDVSFIALVWTSPGEFRVNPKFAYIFSCLIEMCLLGS